MAFCAAMNEKIGHSNLRFFSEAVHAQCVSATAVCIV